MPYCGLQLEADELASREDGLAHDVSPTAAAAQASERSEAPTAAAALPPQTDSIGAALDAAAPSDRTHAEDQTSAHDVLRRAMAAGDGVGAGDAEGRPLLADAARLEPSGHAAADVDGAPLPVAQLPPIVLRTEPADDGVSAEPAPAPPATAEAVSQSQDLRDEEPTETLPEEQSGGACKQS